MAKKNFDDQGNPIAQDPIDDAIRKQMQAKVDTAPAPDASGGDSTAPDYTPPPITTTTSPAGDMQTQQLSGAGTQSITTSPGYTINDLVNPTVQPSPAAKTPPPPPGPTTNTTTPPTLAPGGDDSLLTLLQQGMDPQQAIALFNQVNKRGYGNEAVYYNDKRGITIGLPSGYYAKTPGGWTWTVRGPEGAAGPADLAGDTRGGKAGGFGDTDQGAGVGSDLINSLISQLMGPGGLFGATSSGGSASPYANDPLRQQIIAALSKLIQQGQEPVGDVSNDPSAVAYRLARTRQAEKSRSANAERRASQGLLFSGPMESDIAGEEQSTAQDIGSYEGQLATTILQDRKQKLEYALTTGAGYLQTEQQQELQRQLQETNKALGDANLKMNLINSLLGNQRFYDSLGFDIGQTELTGNQNAVNTVK